MLVAISIILLLVAVGAYALEGARKNSRDSKRKADLQLIMAGTQAFKDSCGSYLSPETFYWFSTSSNPEYPKLTGKSSIADGNQGHDTCTEDKVFLSEIPKDPQFPERIYRYNKQGRSVAVCAALENPPSPPMNTSYCGGPVPYSDETQESVPHAYPYNCGYAECNYVIRSASRF